MIHPLWRTMVNFPLILLNAELKVQCIVLVLGKDTTKHCNAAPLMAKEWAGGNSSWQLWIGMFSGLGVNVVKQVSQNYGKSEARTSFQPSNQKEKPTLTYKVSPSCTPIRHSQWRHHNLFVFNWSYVATHWNGWKVKMQCVSFWPSTAVVSMLSLSQKTLLDCIITLLFWEKSINVLWVQGLCTCNILNYKLPRLSSGPKSEVLAHKNILAVLTNAMAELRLSKLYARFCLNAGFRNWSVGERVCFCMCVCVGGCMFYKSQRGTSGEKEREGKNSS